MKTVCKVLSFIGLLSLMVVGFAGLSALGAAETSPEVRIAHHNLAFTDEVCLLYAVEAEGTGGAAPFMEFRVGNNDLSTPTRSAEPMNTDRWRKETGRTITSLPLTD